MKKRILITVKTYPSLSNSYQELVCTAGITAEGNWIRIYPIPFRKLDYFKRYDKYQWIELELDKSKKDFRPESYKPRNFESAKLLEKIDSDGKFWKERRQLVLRNVYTNLDLLTEDARNKTKLTSLATFKPTEIIDFTYKKVDLMRQEAKRKAIEEQSSLFNMDNPFKLVPALPYKFSYVFRDDSGKIFTRMIEDWETGMLYWNEIKRLRDEKKALKSVKKKYFDDFAKTKDLYFFLGTTKKHHFKKNSFIIIGTFHPKKDDRLKLI